MYHTCLFCHVDLGANEVIEVFPVGRRLAFDAEKGRLWVVCRRCERWNLTPMEERWEAIDGCERAFRGTTLRVSTDNIGLARMKEGLELVRIGRALRPEMAAWRYGDQFGRRRRRAMILGATGFTAVVATALVGIKLGLLTGGGYQVVNLTRASWSYWRRRRPLHIQLAGGERLPVRQMEVHGARLEPQGEHDWRLRMRRAPQFRLAMSSAEEDITLEGADAIYTAGRILPLINSTGAGHGTVRESVALIEGAGDADMVFRRVARHLRRKNGDPPSRNSDTTFLKTLPPHHRLALEMAANEDIERRALEGELRLLEAAWRDAEEVAQISDDLFLPAGIDERLEQLRRPR